MPKGANYDIKTTLSIDGEKAFKAAMEDANRAMRVHNADLRAMAAEYEYTDDKQRYFAQRADVVNEKIRQQEAIVEALNGAIKDSADMFGSASAKTDGYRIQLSNATAKLFEMRQEAEKAQRELEELGRDSPRVGRQIENGIGDAAEDTGNKLDKMFEELNEDISAIRSNTTFSVFADFAGTISGAATSLDDFAESNREYRRSMSFLEQNAQTYGVEFGAVKELFFEMASVTGEADSSVEALSNLMAAGFDAEELVAAVDLLGGAVVRFPDTLKFESLADGLQETLATGKASGQYAELLERMGENTEEFNKELEKAKTAEEDQQIALAYLTKNGLATTYQGYKDTNGELLKAEEATLRLNDAMAGFGKVVDTYLAPAKLFLADVLGGFSTFVNEGAEAAYGMSDEEFWSEMAKKTAGGFGADADKGILRTDFANAFGNIGKGLLELLIPSAGAEELPETELQDYGFRAAQEMANGMIKGTEENATVDAAVKTALSQLDAKDAIDQAMTAGQNLMTSFGNGIAAGTSVPLENVRNMVNQINAMLAQISMPAFGLGWSGITGGNVYLYNAQQNAARTLSTTIGRGVQNKILVK